MLEVKHLKISNLKDGFGLVSDLSFVLNKGDKCAVIGEEGTGKSTLLKSILNNKSLSYVEVSGHIVKHGKIGYLEQDIKVKWQDTTVEAFFLLEHPEAFIDYTEYGKLKNLSKVLNQVMLEEESLDLTKTLAQFSGGEVVKLGLAKLLLQDSEILLLDEPTNDLDFETILFLEDFIIQQEKPVLYISHDERLLENTATSIIHLMRVNKKQAAKTFYEKMSYPVYKSYRLNQDAHQTMVINKQKALQKKKVERFREIYQKVEHAQNQAVRVPSEARLLAKKMKQLKAMEKRYDKEEDAIDTVPESSKPIELSFDDNVQLPNGKVVLDFKLDQLKIANRILACDINLLLKGPFKIVFTGKNGVGKTTLLNAIYQHLTKHSDLKIGYMPQNYEALEQDLTVLEFLEAADDKVIEAKTRKMLGAIGFEREEMVSKTKMLSGGQKAKIYLLKLVLERKEVLILDEPTRNLSPLSAPAVYRLLNDYQGAVICVTHDRTFIENVFDELYILSKKGLTKK